MTTLNISLPEQMRQFIDEQVAGGGYGTASEYIRELIRNAQKEAARARLEALALEGLNSGDPIEVNEEYWRRKHEELRKRLDEQKRANRDNAA